MKAWLITWEWANSVSAVADKVVGIFNPRWSQRRILPLVDYIYSSNQAYLNELMNYAKKPSNNPYPAKIERNGWITCGHNPFLQGRVVSDLEITQDEETNLEIIQWKEPPLYQSKNGRLEIVREGARKAWKRKISGPICHLEIWDRANNGYKVEWIAKLKAGESQCQRKV